MPPEVSYLSVKAARDRLIASGLYDTLPSEEVIEEMLRELETIVDNWLGRRLAPTEYTETVETNDQGIAVLNQYPVTHVFEVWLFPNYHVTRDMTPVRLDQILGLWRQDTRIDVGSHYPNAPIRVRYRAGFDLSSPSEPGIRMLPRIMLQLLSQAIAQGGLMGDYSFLDQAYKETTSISLPGGLSKSFSHRRPSGSGGNSDDKAKGFTVLDNIMKPLEGYRKRYTI